MGQDTASLWDPRAQCPDPPGTRQLSCQRVEFPLEPGVCRSCRDPGRQLGWAPWKEHSAAAGVGSLSLSWRGPREGKAQVGAILPVQLMSVLPLDQ